MKHTTNKTIQTKTYYSQKVQIGDVIDLYNSKSDCKTDKTSKYLSELHSPDFFEDYTSNKHKWSKSTDALKGLEFVVETTAMEGGGSERMGMDVYADGWHVTARQLKKNGTYNPNGNTVNFYQSGDFTKKITEVKVVGKMKLGFTRIK